LKARYLSKHPRIGPASARAKFVRCQGRLRIPPRTPFRGGRGMASKEAARRG